MDVYNSPKNDEAKIRAIIGIIFEFNIAKPEENQKIVALANEAIKIASELKIEYLRDYIEILKNQALFYVIIKKMSEIQMSLQVQNLQNEQSFSFFYNLGLVKFNSFRESVINKINNSLEALLEKKEIYYYIASLPILIDLVTIQTMNFAVFNRDIIIQEKKVGRN